jgi:hypothetical protein
MHRMYRSSLSTGWNWLVPHNRKLLTMTKIAKWAIVSSVTERSDSRWVLTQGSLFYINLLPPCQYSTEKSHSLFRKIYGSGSFFSVLVVVKWSRKIMTLYHFYALVLKDWGHIVHGLYGCPCVCMLFCLSVCKNFNNIGNIVWMLSDMAFIFHVCVPSGQWQNLFTSTLKFGAPDAHFDKLCGGRNIWKSKKVKISWAGRKTDIIPPGIDTTTIEILLVAIEQIVTRDLDTKRHVPLPRCASELRLLHPLGGLAIFLARVTSTSLCFLSSRV